MDVFLEAFGLGRTCDSAGLLNLIGLQQISDMVRTLKGIHGSYSVACTAN